MKKSILFAIVILALITAGTAYLLISDDGEQAKEQMMGGSRSTSQPNNEPSPTSSGGQPGAYVNYENDTISKTAGTKLLFFYAPWCPQCRALETDIEQDGIPSGVTIIKVDYDTNQQLRQKYGVTLQTTFVKVDDNGNLIEKFVAYDDPTLASVIQNIL